MTTPCVAPGFELAADPGAWRGRFGVAVDLMVPEALAGAGGRRCARLPVHGNRAARRTAGLEAALVDNVVRQIVSYQADDARTVQLRVAGPAALLIAKVTKVEERRDDRARHQPKDGLDVLRLLQATPTGVLTRRLVELRRDPLAGPVTSLALAALQRDGRDPAGLLPSLAARSVGNLADPDTIRGSVAVLVEELLTALDDEE